MTFITCFLSQGAIHTFCGAFTTFSAFAYENMTYWHEGKFGAFVLNLFANNLLCLLLSCLEYDSIGASLWKSADALLTTSENQASLLESLLRL